MPQGLPGQSNLDFAAGRSALRILHLGVRNDVGELTPDAFTQTNPPKVANGPSTTLTGITTRGVLGGTVAILRPEIGNGLVGGSPSAAAIAGNRPVGIFINNAIGNPFENAPAVASNKGPFVNSYGTYATRVFETQQILNGPGFPTLAPYYATGQLLYCSQNGYLTNNPTDSIEVEAGGAAVPVAVVAIAPSASFPELVFHLRV